MDFGLVGRIPADEKSPDVRRQPERRQPNVSFPPSFFTLSLSVSSAFSPRSPRHLPPRRVIFRAAASARTKGGRERETAPFLRRLPLSGELLARA